MSDITKDRRIRIITGHFGSGKTEFAVNYAIRLAETGQKTAIADLDVINTYFRSREVADFLREKKIELLSGNPEIRSLDVPAISAEVFRPIEDRSYALILDIGGNPDGAKVLGQFRKALAKEPVDHFFVVNRYRPETRTSEDVIAFLRRTEAFTKIPVTGLVNTTHMLKETKAEDVLYGMDLLEEVAGETRIPVRYTACIKEIVPDLPASVQDSVLPLDLLLRQSWMR